MNSLYSEAEKERQEYEANESKKIKEKLAIKAFKEEKLKRNILKGTLIFIAIVVVIYWGYQIIVPYINFKSNTDSPNQNPDYGSRPWDPYPNLREVNYGTVFFPQGVWFKYIPQTSDNKPRPFTFTSTNYSHQGVFQFCELSNGFKGVRALVADVVTITPGSRIEKYEPYHNIGSEETYLRPGIVYRWLRQPSIIYNFFLMKEPSVQMTFIDQIYPEKYYKALITENTFQVQEGIDPLLSGHYLITVSNDVHIIIRPKQ